MTEPTSPQSETEPSRPVDHHEDAVPPSRTLAMVLTAVVVLAALGTPAILWVVVPRSSASFADRELFDQNRLGAATLDIEAGTSSAGFGASNMIPGDVATGRLELTNAGTLPLRFEVSGVSDGGPLAPWLQFDVWLDGGSCTQPPSAPVTGTGSYIVFGETVGTTPVSLVTADVAPPDALALSVDTSTTVCLAARLPLETGNLAQGAAVTLDLVVDAVHDVDASQSEVDQ